MVHGEIYPALERFGLSSPEIAVYLSSLSLGPQPASVIAKRAKLKRGHTYNILSRLTQRGLIQEFIQRKVRYFTACSPKTLLSILDHQEQQFEVQKQYLLQAIPFLDKIQNPLLSQAKIRFFQGVEGIQEIYEDTIRDADHTIYAIGDFDYYFPKEKDHVLHTWIWNYALRRSKKGIWYHGIVNRSQYSDQAYRRRRKEKRKLKMIHNVPLPVEVNIYGDKVAIMSSHQDTAGLIIEDAPIAETFRNFHQAIWEFLPDYC